MHQAGLTAVYNIGSAVGRVGFGKFQCRLVWHQSLTCTDNAGLGADSFIGPLTSLSLSLYVAGLAIVALWPFSTTPALVGLFAALNGAGCGGWFALLPSVAGCESCLALLLGGGGWSRGSGPDKASWKVVLGDEKVSSGLGIIELCSCVGFLLGSPLAGFLLASAGGETAGLAAYKPAMVCAGFLLLS